MRVTDAERKCCGDEILSTKYDMNGHKVHISMECRLMNLHWWADLLTRGGAVKYTFTS